MSNDALQAVMDAHSQWRSRVQDREIAEETLIATKAAKMKQIALLRAEIVHDQQNHIDTWKMRNKVLRSTLDNAALRCLAMGMTPNKLLAHLGSRDVNWAYALRDSGRVPVLSEADAKVVLGEHPALEGVHWEYHDHSGAHGVLKGSTGHYKFYNLQDTEQWFIVDEVGKFLNGNKLFFSKYPQAEIDRLTILLTQLLEGTYGRATNISKSNPFTN